MLWVQSADLEHLDARIVIPNRVDDHWAATANPSANCRVESLVGPALTTPPITHVKWLMEARPLDDEPLEERR